VARLLWDPGRLTSPDIDLISALSSLAIASSFPEDLVAAVDVPPLDPPILSNSLDGSVRASMVGSGDARHPAVSSGDARHPAAPAFSALVVSGGGARLTPPPPISESIMLERGSLPPPLGGVARSSHPPLCRSDGGVAPAGLTSAPQRASGCVSLGTWPACIVRAAPGLSLLPPGVRPRVFVRSLPSPIRHLLATIAHTLS
jgi:hypothetical protein